MAVPSYSHGGWDEPGANIIDKNSNIETTYATENKEKSVVSIKREAYQRLIFCLIT